MKKLYAASGLIFLLMLVLLTVGCDTGSGDPGLDSADGDSDADTTEDGDTEDDTTADGDVDTADGDVTDGDVTDGDVTDGDVTDGDVTDGDVTDGDVTDGDVTDGDVTDGDITDGDVTDGDITDGDITDGDVTDGDVPYDWEGVGIVSANAPDRETIVVSFSGEVDPDAASDRDSYGLQWAAGPLRATAVSYNPEAQTATLTTPKQKLGLMITLTVGGKEDLVAEFPTADRVHLWVSDFSTNGYEDMELEFYRDAIGEHAVIYVQDGYAATDAQGFIQEFDTAIFPRESEIYYSPSDMDGNGKVVMLYLDGADYYGGYFTALNQLPNSQTMEWWGLHSNEMEIIHINVLTEPQTYGHVTAHEYQHLLYHTRHGFTDPYWEYHNEGLAETAVHAVYGENSIAQQYYYWDPDNKIRMGLPLVDWGYGLYENYCQAYLFWVYLAGLVSGDVSAFSQFFDLDTGSPEEVSQYLSDLMDMDLPTAHMFSMLALRVKDETGPFSFNGMIEQLPMTPNTVVAGTQSLDLKPFSGAWFAPAVNALDYPSSQGAHIVYVGVNGSGEVDTEAPFQFGGGALLAYNRNLNYQGWPKEHSGPDMPSARSSAADRPAPMIASEFLTLGNWLNPPPYDPYHPERWAQWRKARGFEE